MRIAVTATGGGVGQSIIKSLKGFDVVALDSDELGAGLYMAGKHYIIPQANDPEYIPRLLEICDNKKIDYLFPGMDVELDKLSRHIYDFEEIGTQVIISKPDVIKIADDKWLTNQFIFNLGLPTAKTSRFSVIAKTFHYGFPAIIKPQRGGARSKNVYKLKSQDDMPNNINLTEYIAQEYIEGDEYTCGTMTIGSYYGCIVMRRILRDGDTYKAFVVRNPVIEDLCEIICNKLLPFGAFNIQLRMRDGKPYVFEFNARCSGTTACRSLAGFNEPKMIVEYLEYGKKPEYKIKEMTILRYWNEIIKK